MKDQQVSCFTLHGLFFPGTVRALWHPALWPPTETDEGPKLHWEGCEYCEVGLTLQSIGMSISFQEPADITAFGLA